MAAVNLDLSATSPRWSPTRLFASQKLASMTCSTIAMPTNRSTRPTRKTRATESARTWTIWLTRSWSAVARDCLVRSARKSPLLSSRTREVSKPGLRSRKESAVFGWSRIPKNTGVGVGFFYATPEAHLNDFIHCTPKLRVLTRAC